MERSFEVGDLVYFHFQPYQQSWLKEKGKEKLKPQFYGPYRVVCCVGEVTYKLKLPKGSRIHNVFHVSCLKKVVGQNVTVATNLPPLNEEGKLILEPTEIIKVREKTLQNGMVKEYLVHWKHLPLDDATWEGKHILQHPTLHLLEDKQNLGREDDIDDDAMLCAFLITSDRVVELNPSTQPFNGYVSPFMKSTIRLLSEMFVTKTESFWNSAMYWSTNPICLSCAKSLKLSSRFLPSNRSINLLVNSA